VAGGQTPDERDWIWICLVALWQRWFPEKPSFERLDDKMPQCQARQPMVGHGFYRRTLVDVGFDGTIRVRRYLCRSCKRTVSMLPEFALPYLRFSMAVISLFLVARFAGGAHAEGGCGSSLATPHALPARPVLDPPLPAASRGSAVRSAARIVSVGSAPIPRVGRFHLVEYG
jgi:hypothetical protein